MSSKAGLTVLLFLCVSILGVSLYVAREIINGSLAVSQGWLWLFGIPLEGIGILYIARELKS